MIYAMTLARKFIQPDSRATSTTSPQRPIKLRLWA